MNSQTIVQGLARLFMVQAVEVEYCLNTQWTNKTGIWRIHFDKHYEFTTKFEANLLIG